MMRVTICFQEYVWLGHTCLKYTVLTSAYICFKIRIRFDSMLVKSKKKKLVFFRCCQSFLKQFSICFSFCQSELEVILNRRRKDFIFSQSTFKNDWKKPKIASKLVNSWLESKIRIFCVCWMYFLYIWIC